MNSITARTAAATATRHAALSRPLVLLLASGAGLAVASIYYSQPMLGVLGGALGASARDTGFVPTLTQLGYALGILLQAIFGWSFTFSVLASAGIVLAYTYLGGLSSAIYNEVLQFFLIVAGFAPLARAGPGEPILVRLPATPSAERPVLLRVRATAGEGSYRVVALGSEGSSGRCRPTPSSRRARARRSRSGSRVSRCGGNVAGTAPETAGGRSARSSQDRWRPCSC